MLKVLIFTALGFLAATSACAVQTNTAANEIHVEKDGVKVVIYLSKDQAPKVEPPTSPQPRSEAMKALVKRALSNEILEQQPTEAEEEKRSSEQFKNSEVVRQRMMTNEFSVATTAASFTPEQLSKVVIPAKTKQLFAITSEDETLYLALRRWASESNIQLVWSAGKDFPVKHTIYQSDTVKDAVAMVMKDTESSDYPLHACSYKNNVIRVLHISQSCEKK